MIKYLSSIADKEKGICIVDVEDNRGKLFTGRAKLMPGDNWSPIFGCRIAEIRATIKAIDYEIFMKRKEYKTIENFVKAVGGYKNFDKESPTARCMYRQLNRRKKEITILKERKSALKKYIIDSIEMKNRLEKKIDKMKNTKNAGKEN